MVNAIKLALQEAGGKAGPLSVTYVSLDSATREDGDVDERPACSTTRAQAVRDLNAIAYIGDRDSAATALSLPLTNEGHVLQVSPSSTYDGLTRAGRARTGEPERFYPSGKRTFGRMVPADHVQASALVGYMKAEGVRSARAARPTASSTAAGSPTRSRRPPRGRASRSSTRAASTHAGATSPAGSDSRRRPPPTRSCSPATTDTGAARIFEAVAAAAPQHAAVRSRRRRRRSAFADALGAAVQRRMRITTPTLPPRLLPASARAVPRRASARRSAAQPAPEALHAYEATQRGPARDPRRRARRATTATP